jgi:hypothetical protein
VKKRWRERASASRRQGEEEGEEGEEEGREGEDGKDDPFSLLKKN